MTARQQRSGLTLIELMIGMVLMLFIATLTVLAAAATKEEDNRVRCASNLRHMGQAMLLYSHENKGQFPRVRYNPEAPKPVFYTNSKSKVPFDKDAGPQHNDVTAAIYLLMRTQDINEQVMICPSSDDKAWNFRHADEPANADQQNKRLTALDASNFPAHGHLSYSMANPYPGVAAAGEYRWNNAVDAAFVLAADMNPGTDVLVKLHARAPQQELNKGNSFNHFQDGQNILCGDGHTEFIATPFAGVERDNIYTYGVSGPNGGGDGIEGAPVGMFDSVLLPTTPPDRRNRPRPAEAPPAQ